MAETESAGELREHLRVVEEFLADYRSYISFMQNVFGPIVPPHGTSQEDQRERILRKAPRAQRAINAAGANFAITPPPAFGGPLLEELSTQVMAHENSMYSPDDDPFMVSRMVLDSLTAATGALEDQIDQAESGHGRQRTPVSGNQSSTPSTAQARFPTLWGHLGNLPHGLSVAADVVTVVLGIAAIVAFLVNVVF